ncbi:MAG TPA: flagellar biosynthesis regulator FlaF [Nitrospirae bacterium]|nr:flagellar biosynthesis regulator FlaF [Nitrospirota bacterium]
MLKISDLKITNPSVASSNREIEAIAIDKATVMLEYCRDNWNLENIRELLFEALRHNQTLWTILRNDMRSQENLLPQEIKNNIIALANFINKRTFEIQSFPIKEKLNILIDINKNISAGLKGSPSD